MAKNLHNDGLVKANQPSLVLPAGSARMVNVDARGLEPPQPLLVILEAVATLPEDSELYARTDRRPMHLYEQLTDRGFSGETQPLDDGSFLTRIRRV